MAKEPLQARVAKPPLLTKAGLGRMARAKEKGLKPQPRSKNEHLEPLREQQKQQQQQQQQRASGGGHACEATVLGVPLRWVSLVALTFQTSFQVFVIKFARAGGTPYRNSCVVFLAEVLKTILSFVMLALTSPGGVSMAVHGVRRGLSRENHFETLKLFVPACAYCLQNNLIFYSMEHLSAAVQQVTYQLKILTAALMGVILLGRSLTSVKWMSLLMLVLGVVLVQFPKEIPTLGPAVARISSSTHPRSNSSSLHLSSSMLGFGAVLLACIISGFAGAYMEMLLKRTTDSLWLRNIFLGLFGSLVALASVRLEGLERGLLDDGGLLEGFSWRVWLATVTLATGGLIVAVVLKHADNILRQFSTALSLLLTSSLSFAAGEFQPDILFGVGTILTIGATFMYNLGLPSCTGKK